MTAASVSTHSSKQTMRRRDSMCEVVGLVAIVSGLVIGTAAQAQEGGQPDPNKCRQAAHVLRAYDQAVVRSRGQANQGSGKAEQRQLAAARLLSCGPVGGVEAAFTIRLTRTLSDPTTLEELVGPFRSFRDTAVVNAAVEIATDASASVPARLFALRTMWVIQTGKFWMVYDELVPRQEAPDAQPTARCGQGLQVADATPSWRIGSAPPAGFEAELQAVARRLRADLAQPLEVRAAALCVLLP